MEPLNLTVDLVSNRFVYPGDLGVGLRQLEFTKGVTYGVNLSFSSGYSGSSATPSGISWNICEPNRKNSPLVSLSSAAGTSFPLYVASPVLDYAINGRDEAILQSNVAFTCGGVNYNLSPLTTLLLNNPSLSPQQEYYPASNPSGFLTSSSIAIGSNVLYVDPNGSNSTAVAGNPTKPFATISAALSGAESGQTVYAFPGTYNEQITFKNGVELYLEAGATVTYTGVGSTFTDNGNTIGTFRIAGHGSLQNAGAQETGAVFLLSNDNNSVYVECQDILLSTTQTPTGEAFVVIPPLSEIATLDFSFVNIAEVIAGGIVVSDAGEGQWGVSLDPTVPLSQSVTDTANNGNVTNIYIGVQDSPSASQIAEMFVTVIAIQGGTTGGYTATANGNVVTVSDSNQGDYGEAWWSGTATGVVFTEIQAMTNGPALEVGTAANGPGNTGGVNYVQAAIFSCNGYLEVTTEHIVTTGCPAIVRTGAGRFFINAATVIP